MEDLSGLRISVGIVFHRLQRPKEIQCTPRKLRIDQDVLKRGNQAVPSEWGDEPGKASCRQERLAIRCLDWKPERGHILECAPKQSVEFLVARLNLGDRLQPISQSFGVFRFFAVADAIARRLKMPAAILQCIQKAGVPGVPGLESYFEAEPAMGIRSSSGTSYRTNSQRHAELPPAIGRAKPLLSRQPSGRDPPAPDTALRFHLEDLRK